MRSVYFCLLELLTWDLHLVPSPVSIRSFGYQITNPCGETRQIWPVFLYISLGTIHRQLLIWSLPWLTISPMTFPISSIWAFMISALKRRNWNGWAVSCRHISIVHYPRKLASRCVSLDGPLWINSLRLCCFMQISTHFFVSEELDQPIAHCDMLSPDIIKSLHFSNETVDLVWV